MAELSNQSTEYVKIPVSTTENGLPVDPTDETVEMAFTEVGDEPAANDWNTATWETDDSRNPPIYYAKILVGPAGGAVEFDRGTKRLAWWRVTSTPETPVGRGKGTLDIY